MTVACPRVCSVFCFLNGECTDRSNLPRGKRTSSPVRVVGVRARAAVGPGVRISEVSYSTALHQNTFRKSILLSEKGFS
jgi:hypothetical protein